MAPKTVQQCGPVKQQEYRDIYKPSRLHVMHAQSNGPTVKQLHFCTTKQFLCVVFYNIAPSCSALIYCSPDRNQPHGHFQGKEIHPFILQYYSIVISFNFFKSFIVKQYSHHSPSVQSPHTTDAILFCDVSKRHCGYHPYYVNISLVHALPRMQITLACLFPCVLCVLHAWHVRFT